MVGEGDGGGHIGFCGLLDGLHAFHQYTHLQLEITSHLLSLQVLCPLKIPLDIILPLNTPLQSHPSLEQWYGRHQTTSHHHQLLKICKMPQTTGIAVQEATPHSPLLLTSPGRYPIKCQMCHLYAR